MKILAYGLSDKGLSRKNNEDSFFVDRDLGLFIAADGMGGRSAGEVASRMTTEVLGNYIRKAKCGGEPLLGPPDPTRSEASNRLVSGIRLANQVVHEAAGSNPGWQGMGTTIVAALVDGDRLSIAHAGDSRAYLIRSSVISRLTDDHSVVAEQVRMGLISKEDAESSGIKNIITRALGYEPELEVDVAEIDIMDGDRILLCSDGLTNMVSDDDIEALIRSSEDPETACKKLVDAANGNGGLDNITAVMVCFYGESLISRLKNIFSGKGRRQCQN